MPLDPNEPIDLEAAKLHLGVDYADDDAAIERAVVAARRWVEKYTGHILLKREMTKAFASFETVRLRETPLDATADVTVSYRDADDVETALTGFRLGSLVRPARLFSTATWPTVAEVDDAVTVTFTAGYDPGEVPEDLQAAMLVLVAGMYDNREGFGENAERAAKSLCKEYRPSGVA